MLISPVDTVWVEASHNFLWLLFSLETVELLLFENASVMSVNRDSSLSILSVLSSVESARILLTISIDSVRVNGGDWSCVRDEGWLGERKEERWPPFSPFPWIGDLTLGEFNTRDNSLEPSDATDSKLGSSWSSRSESSSESSFPFCDPDFCLFKYQKKSIITKFDQFLKKK